MSECWCLSTHNDHFQRPIAITQIVYSIGDEVMVARATNVLPAEVAEAPIGFSTKNPAVNWVVFESVINGLLLKAIGKFPKFIAPDSYSAPHGVAQVTCAVTSFAHISVPSGNFQYDPFVFVP